MTFTSVFGGTVVYPAEVSYRAVSLTADTELSWPTELATDTNVVAKIMNVTATAGPWDLILPPADQASVGETTLIFNVGSNAFVVTDNGGNTIVSIAPGLAYQLFLTGNATPNGVWGQVQYGAGTSSATAGSLAGLGVKAIGTSLNQSMSVTTISLNYSFAVATDRSQMFVWTGGAGTLTLPLAANAGNDWFVQIRNNGTGAITLAPSGSDQINGAASLVFNPGDSAIIACSGSAWFSVGFGQSTSFTFDYDSIDLTAETTPFTLTGANLNRIAYNFGGTIASNFDIIVPATIQQYWVTNSTTGGFVVVIKTASGTGISIAAGESAILYCDGVNVVDADTSGVAFPISIANGGTGATNTTDARTNLNAAKDGVNADITRIAALSDGGASGPAVTFLSESNTGMYRSGAGALSFSILGTAEATLSASGFNIASGNAYSINGSSVLNATTLGSGVTASSLTSVGTLTSGALGSGFTTVAVGQGGTGITTATTNGVVYGNGTSALGVTAAGTTGQVLVGNTGGAPSWATLTGIGVTSFSAGTTGLTPSTGTTGAVTLAGTLGVANGGTGVTVSTGTGSVVLNDSPVFVTPSLGVASATSIANGLGAVGTPSYTFTGDTNTGMWSPAADTVAVSTAGSERARVDNAGRVILGHTSSLSVAGRTSLLQTYTANLYTGARYNSASSAGANFSFARSRSATPGSFGVVSANDAIASINFSGDDGSAFVDAASIIASVDGTPGTGDMPGRLQFLTTADGAASPTERMRIDSSGNVGIGTSSPISNLHVNSTGNTLVRITTSFANSVSTGLYIDQPGDSAAGRIAFAKSSANRGAILFRHNASAASEQMEFNVAGSNVIEAGYSQTLFRSNNVERMRIDSAGNVGIGTSSPGSPLDVQKVQNAATAIQVTNTDAGASASARLVATNGTTTGGVIMRGTGTTEANYLVIYNSSTTAPVSVYTNGSERMRVTAAGDVGIGTASPSSKLHVAGALTLDTALSAANGGTGLTSPGTSGNVLTSNGSAWVSSAPSGSANLQEFTSSGTWTKPSGVSFVMVECWGAGGGGGSGARGAAATDRTGGGGGGGGAYTFRLFKASDLGATETVTIGAGGTGGAARTTNGGSNAGVNGGNTTFGTKLTSYGGGRSNGSTAGAGGGVLSAASASTRGEPVVGGSGAGQFGGANTNTPAGFGGAAGASGAMASVEIGACSYQGGAGGGGGGQITSANATSAGTAGGFNAGVSGGGGAGGGSGTGTAGAAGTDIGMAGGGGGSGDTAGTVAGGAGGAGGIAAGGGGGGASTTGANSGAGGKGGDGYCRVYSW